MTGEAVLGTEELRRDLAQVLGRMNTDPQEVVVIGRQRKPEAVLVSFSRWQDLLAAESGRENTAGQDEIGSGAHEQAEPTEAGGVGIVAASGDLHWDPRDGVAFEVAESVLGNLISVCVVRISEAEQAADPDSAAIASWRERLIGYARQRKSLTVSDPATLRRVVERYGAELREMTGRPQ